MTEPTPRWEVNAARGGGRSHLLRDLWAARDIVRVFVARDIQLRYRQAALGVVWVLLQPVATVALLTVVFSRVQRETTAIPYPVFALVGMLGWLYFVSAVGRGSEILVDNPSLVTKVWFPRISALAAAMISPLVDLGIGFVLLIILELVVGVPLRWTLVLLPLVLVLLIAVALGVVLFLSALNVRFRDVRHAIGPVLQIVFFATPVAYSLDVVPPWGGAVVAFNPLTGVVEAARWAALGTPCPLAHLAVSVIWAAALLVGGSLYFRSAERTFADVI